jgi:hypothetical protein
MNCLLDDLKIDGIFVVSVIYESVQWIMFLFQYEILFLLQAFRRLYEQVDLGWSFVREFCKISYNLFLQHLSYQIMLLYYVPLMFCTPMILRIRTNVNVLKNMVGKHYRFRPRILINVSKIDMSTIVLGFKISMPIMIAPTAMQKMAHPEGIIAFSLNSLEFLKCKIKLFCFVQYFVRRKKFMKNQA